MTCIVWKIQTCPWFSTITKLILEKSARALFDQHWRSVFTFSLGSVNTHDESSSWISSNLNLYIPEYDKTNLQGVKRSVISCAQGSMHRKNKNCERFNVNDASMKKMM